MALAGCSGTAKSPDVSDGIRRSLDQAGLKDVSVSQDRDKGVVTLDGHVPSDGDKSQPESIAKSMAGAQVVSNQIGVIPLSCLSWKWRKRSSVKTLTERTHEKATEALHAGREGRHSEAAFSGRSANLASV
jgi:osmotically-inducible protein OsmY